MKRPKVRIGTLMFLVVIAALTVALVLERRRSARLMVEVEAGRAMEASARANAERVLYAERLARVALASQVAKAKLEADEKPAGEKPR